MFPKAQHRLHGLHARLEAGELDRPQDHPRQLRELPGFPQGIEIRIGRQLRDLLGEQAPHVRRGLDGMHFAGPGVGPGATVKRLGRGVDRREGSIGFRDWTARRLL